MKRPFRWILILVVLGLVAVGVEYGLLVRDANETIEESERIERRMLNELNARDGTRPTLGEPAGDGDAREIYEAVMPLMSELSNEEHGVVDFLFYPFDSDVSPSHVEALVVRTQPLMERLRPALTAPRMSPHHALETPATDVKHVEHWQSFGNLVWAHVRHHVANDRVVQAIDLAVLRWFAGFDFARDGSLVGYLVGNALALQSAEELRWIFADCDVPAARLERLAIELDVLRSSAPSLHRAWEVEEMHLRHMTRIASRQAGFLFDNRLLCAGALVELTPIRKRMITVAEGRSGRAYKSEAEQIVDEIDDNPILRMHFVVYPHTIRGAFRLKSIHDMLRVNVALARYRETHRQRAPTLASLVPDLLSEIPICAYSGEALRYDGDKLWSIGSDGVDDGGDLPVPYDDWFSNGDKGDAVFTLRLRELREFPWLDEIDAGTRRRVETKIADLYKTGETEPFESEDRPICSRLISEFKAIEDDIGFDDPEGRRRVAKLDGALRTIDGAVAWQWLHPYAGVGDDTPAYARRTALRWANWWYRQQWRTDPISPWEPDEED